MNASKISTRLLWAGIATLATTLVSPSWSMAVPLYQLRTNGIGVPLVLDGTGGHAGFAVHQIGSTNDGLVQVFDAGSSGHEFHTLDPSLEEANDATTGAAKIALTQIWLVSQDHYTASVSTATKSASGNFFGDGVTRALPTTGSHFGWQGGGTADIREIRFEDPSGLLDADSGEVATRMIGTTTNGSTGLHKAGLALIGETGIGTDAWMVTAGHSSIGAGSGAPINSGVRKQEWGALTGLDLGTPAAGTRTVTVGGDLVDGALSDTGLIDSLVPGIGDLAMDMAYNPLDGNLYFITRDTGSSRVFLAAITFEWAPSGDFTNDSIATIIDLDPDAADTFLELTYDPSLNASDSSAFSLLTANALTFSPDGTRLFVGNGPAGNRLFQFDLFVEPPFNSIPEPSTAMLLGLGMVAMAGCRRRKRS